MIMISFILSCLCVLCVFAVRMQIVRFSAARNRVATHATLPPTSFNCELVLGRGNQTESVLTAKVLCQGCDRNGDRGWVSAGRVLRILISCRAQYRQTPPC